MSLLTEIIALKAEAREKYAEAEAENRQAEMDRLKAYYDDLKRAEQRYRNGQMADAAAEISALAERLDQATSEIQHKVDTLFFDDLKAAAEALTDQAGELIREVRHNPAPEPDDTVAPTGKAKPPKTPDEYLAAFNKIKLRDAWRDRVDGVVNLIVKPDRARRYRSVELSTGVPWWVVGIIHMLEASGNIRLHLHNGDPLSAPTVNVPVGRPKNWRLGMTWAESAADALTGEGRNLDAVEDWSVGAALEILEEYNGLGYRKRKLMSPYLWSGSEYYTKGKYVADSKFDPEAISEQVGAACLIKRMSDRDLISISEKNKDISLSPAGALGDSNIVDLDLSPFPHAREEIDFPGTHNQKFGKGCAKMIARRIQEWCDLQGITTAIDGDFGEATEESVTRFQKRHALPQTGEVDRTTWLLLTAPMRRALAPVEAESSLSETYIKVGRQHIAQSPRERAGQNRGPWVRLYMNGKEGEPQLWCAGFISTLMSQAARDMNIKVPFERQVSVDKLVKDAKDADRFLSEADLSDPDLRPSKVLPGMLFVIRASATDWTHVGIVTSARKVDFDTIEGNTNGSNNNGGEAKPSTRNYSNKDFLRLV